MAEPTPLHPGSSLSDSSRIAGGGAARDGTDDEISVLEIVNMLLKRRRLVVGFPLLTGLIVAGISLLIPSTYRAITALVPESRSQNRLPTGISSLAGQLGFQLGVDATQSPRFYADVLKSRGLLERVIGSRYADPRTSDPADSISLLPVLQAGGNSHTDSMYRAARKLYTMVDVRVDPQTSILRVSVDSRYPTLAAAIANRFVEYLNDFNTQSRQSQARERRKFAEGRAVEAQQSLAEVEDQLRDFHDRNRRWAESVKLQFQEARLRRQLSIQQEVYLTLRREYESSRIEEVNETPVITVIDSAAVPNRKVKPVRSLLVLVSVALAGLLAVTVALVAGFAERAGTRDSSEHQRYQALLAESRDDLRSLFGARRSRSQ